MSKNQWKTIALSLLVIIMTLVTIVLNALMPASAIEPQKEKLIAQGTSVTQFKDVDPSADYYQAVQSLLERYGSFAGDPDGYMRPEREMVRGELLSNLNASSDRINELIATATADLATKEDIARLLKRLKVAQKLIAEIRTQTK